MAEMKCWAMAATKDKIAAITETPPSGVAGTIENPETASPAKAICRTKATAKGPLMNIQKMGQILGSARS